MSKDIVKSLNTEKTHNLVGCGVYVFLFQKDKCKEHIKRIIEKKYSIKINAINVLNMPKKVKSFRGVVGRRSRYKKVYVRVANGMKIDIENSVNSKSDE